MLKWGHNCFFWKNSLCKVRVVFLENFSQRKRSSASGKRGFHPCFCLPACCNCPVALSEFTTLLLHDSTLFKLDSFKKCNCSRKNLLQKQFASQMWAARPHLGSIFEKLLHRKTFHLCFAQTFHIAFSISLCYNETNIRKEHLLCIVSSSPSLP